MIDVENCWYKEVCNLNNDCSKTCPRFTQMKFLIENSNLPTRLSYPIPLEASQCDLDAFYLLRDIKDDIVAFVQAGQSLYLYSDNFGNGKTTWASKLMLKYFDNIWASNGYRVRGLFIPVTEFLVDLKHNITLNNKQTYYFYEMIKQVDLVVWDDVGVTGASPMELEALYALINYRSSAGLANIFTGNLNCDKLHEVLGARLCSRIWNASERINLKGEDRRQV